MLRRLVGVLAAVCVAGCTTQPVTAEQVTRPAEVGVSGAVGAAGGRVSVPGGPVIDVPAGSVSGEGELVVRRAGKSVMPPESPSPFLSTLDAYELRLRGARLTGPLRLTVPVVTQPLPTAADEDSSAVLGHYDDATARWSIVPAEYDPDRHTITAEVYELSWWNAFGWDFSALRNAVAADYRNTLAVTASAPVCPNELAARRSGLRVEAGRSGRVLWCYGVDGGAPVLKVTNVRGYPVSVRFPGAWRGEALGNGVELPAGLGGVHRSAAGTETTLLTGGSTVVLHPGTLRPAGVVSTGATGDAFLGMALTFGLKAFGSAMDGVPGAPVVRRHTSELVLADVLAGGCLKKFTVTDVESLGEAEESVLKAHQVAFGCLQTAWKKRYELDGRSGRFTEVGLTWLTAGIPVLIDGITGVADEAVFMEPHTIRVRETSSATLLPGQLPGQRL
ncbi:hypothetical protein [Kineosporia sp. NBRC 101731]|uniref:hypothetical protein n=1 Tax=Kineosporia sp. NBRC 101731 TaxID=3032199 RepID=UPI0024A187FD|nr:hypothetical protein [Kineosporia sp. NBRC 101731]GLY28216.1 hypothetical protein Kisp02_15810 [Kineosporia sp. NBRC 101731]